MDGLVVPTVAEMARIKAWMLATRHTVRDYLDDIYCHNGTRARYEGYCTEVFFRQAMAFLVGKILVGISHCRLCRRSSCLSELMIRARA